MKRWIIFAIAAVTFMVAVKPSSAQVQETVFNLTAQQKFVSCFAQADYTPTAQVIVQRGTDNDVLILRAQHLRPNLSFDLFTIQNSKLLADGQINPYFTSFGLAWYQSDLTADSNGNVDIAIKTIWLDQIFGFDPATNLLPTNTLHVGFWFDNPNDAATCGFNANKPTPFNGQHKAGPDAMISLPDSLPSLGPGPCVPLLPNMGRVSFATSTRRVGGPSLSGTAGRQYPDPINPCSYFDTLVHLYHERTKRTPHCRGTSADRRPHGEAAVEGP